MKCRLFISICITLTLVIGITATHQVNAAYPDRYITLIMPFGVGNAPDTIARVIAEYLQDKHGITMLIVSKPGGSGIPGLIDLMKAKPDGYTLCLTSANALTVVPQVKPCGFTYKDLTAVVQLAVFTMGWGVKSDSDITSVDDLMAKAKVNPKKYSLGSPGSLTAQRFFHAQLMKHFPGSDLPYVPYDGGAELVTALLGNHISVAYTPIPNMRPHGDAIRIIAVSSRERDPNYPDVPTFAELYDKNLIFESIYGVVAPKNIPADRLQRLEELFKEALADPGVKGKLAKLYISPNYLSSKEFGDVLKSYNDFFSEPIKRYLEQNK